MIKFLHRPKPRQFTYRPLYYDPDKEARDKRRDELLGARPAEKGEEYVPGTIIRSQIGARRERLDSERRARKGKTVRMVIIVAAAVAMVLWIFLT